ncbi:MAG: hypothetical protein KKC77_19595, partial [Proteobacteria bacterium]|nr:hypothetical protein [Pseudomonadota bacterium]
MEYIGNTKSNNSARFVPFVFATNDTALIEFTASVMRVWVNDALVTRPTATATVGAFSTWTDADEGTASSVVNGTTLEFNGDGSGAARRYVAVTTASQNIEHALRVVIARGPVTIRVGTSATDDSYINETELGQGTHSLSFTPTGTFYITLMARQVRLSVATSCAIEAAGVMEIPTDYSTAAYLSALRTDQSGDVVFCACAGLQQQMVERRSTTSWSIVDYLPEDGPFKAINTGPITLSSSGLSGNVTITASKPLFRTGNIGGLYKLVSEGQEVSSTIAAENTFTDPIEVTGVGSDRTFTITLAGTWAGGSVVTLQRSIGAVGSWSDVDLGSWTADSTSTFADELDNQIVYYRIGIKTGDFGGGADSIACGLTIATGSADGVVRLTAFISPTSASAEVLSTLGGLTATDLWYEGDWSDQNGWPSAVALHEGRLWWAGLAKLWGSITDAYASFNPDIEGDSGTISRSIGAGPVDTISWMASNQRLLVGTTGSEYSARASTLDEPLSPTAFVIKPASNQGCADVDAVKVDNRCIYVQRNGNKIYELSFDTRWYDYSAKDLTAIIPEIGSPGIVRIAMQRQQDTRIHCVRSDGTVAINVQDRNEDMFAWCDVETDGIVEDAVVLPGVSGEQDDHVYYVVNRTINGSTVRYLEKWAQQDECEGGTVNKQADAFIHVSQIASKTVNGLSHLEGEAVVVWADGADVGTETDYTQTYTVSGGSITLAAAAAEIIVGLPYTAPFQSMKLGSPTNNMPTVLTHHKNANHIGLVLADTHKKGLRFGPDFDNLDSMPDMELGKQTTTEVWVEYDEEMIEFPGTWNTDTRV